MAILARIGFAIVKWKARKGLQAGKAAEVDEKKLEALGIGALGERYAYWYLRWLGYLFLARNYTPAQSKGEIDLVGNDGKTLAFVEVRTRATVKGKPALPGLNITREKHAVFVRTANESLRGWHIEQFPGGSTSWLLVTVRESLRWCDSIRMAGARKFAVHTCREFRSSEFCTSRAVAHFPFAPVDVQYGLCSTCSPEVRAGDWMEDHLPELRKDPITGRWVIISTERGKRPMDFLRESVFPGPPLNCPFCPGSETKTPPEILAYGRNGGGANTPGWNVRVVPNRFPALGIEGELDREGEGLFDKMNGIGAHEVIIETPQHQTTLAQLPQKAVEDVFWAYRDRMLDLKNDKRFRYVLIFKNHGEAAGASIEHPHSQLIALPIVPRRVREEVDNCWHYYDEKERCIFCDIIRQERDTGERVIGENEHFITLAPYAPRFPFEMWLLPKVHGSAYENNQSSMYASLAQMMKDTLMRLEAVLDRPAYNFMIHTSPIGEEINDHYHWHIEIIPKLTKVAGFEWGTGFYINPTPPEESARFLREAQIEEPTKKKK